VPILIGVDAGGSTISCAIERDGKILASMGEAANVRVAGIERAADAIARAVRGGLRDDDFSALVVGAAGAGDDGIARALEGALRDRFARGVIAVVDDAEIALRAAIVNGDGAVLIAGTGSIAYARVGNAAFRVGGYGYLLGDDGSGFAIGRAALALMLRWYDDRSPRSDLFDAIATRLQVANAQELLNRIYGEAHPVAAIAAVAPLVLEHASAGERGATKIVQGAALELVDLVKALVKRAKIEGEIPLVFAGGLLAENSLLSYLIETRLLGDLPLVHPVKSPPAPVHGALELARRLAG
jgi:N-acetylglucosamine kinase-like BadF-type ATPase